ncbi:hypothetical protein GBAR_LOCUS4523 [Geodia barretti]|uniref:Uncharacterized protein n=1 Tax=Geodia barretti TaxID=519541 RepID=A0AA35R7U3_GEOBA|nr:hypothetical protein GBAR_LOCUS4523 [Geodia barretti]
MRYCVISDLAHPLPSPCLHQSRLASAEDVKGWIPSIEKEISYLLKQIEGTGSRKHNDAKIEEFQERIDHLQREHKRFVAKVRSLDPSYRDVVPWQPRGYKRKRHREGQSTEPAKEASGPQIKRLYSPLLAEEEKMSSKKPVSSSTSQEFHVLSEGILQYSIPRTAS